jgi:hypothetical protein
MYVQRKVPALCVPGPLKEESVPKQSLPVECLSTILTFLDVRSPALASLQYFAVKNNLGENCGKIN